MIPKPTPEQVVEYIKRDLTWIEGFAAAVNSTLLEQKSYNIRNLLNHWQGHNSDEGALQGSQAQDAG